MLRAYGALDDETCSPVGKERKAGPSASVGMTPVVWLVCQFCLSGLSGVGIVPGSFHSVTRRAKNARKEKSGRFGQDDIFGERCG